MLGIGVQQSCWIILFFARYNGIMQVCRCWKRSLPVNHRLCTYLSSYWQTWHVACTPVTYHVTFGTCTLTVYVDMHTAIIALGAIRSYSTMKITKQQCFLWICESLCHKHCLLLFVNIILHCKWLASFLQISVRVVQKFL